MLKSPEMRRSDGDAISSVRREENSSVKVDSELEGGRYTRRTVQEADSRENLTHSDSKDE